MNFERALVLAPHPDDGEFAAGATIKKLTEAGTEVHYAAFSPCVKSVPKGYGDFEIYREMERAVGHLGITGDRVLRFEFPVREFPQYRQEILEELVKLKKDLQPELVLLPSENDVHQDHHQIHLEGIRAFKFSSILGYELPWNNWKTAGNLFVSVEEHHLQAKVAALAEYKTQSFRHYMSSEFVNGLARVRGVQGGVTYAESFEVVRMNA